MEEFTTVHLDLRAPLVFAEASELVPFAFPFFGEGPAADVPLTNEFLFCFEIDGEQAGRIEPDADAFLGKLIFSGRKGDGKEIDGEQVILPAGLYLFSQRRRDLGKEECVAMAVEQQKDGLWERLNPGGRLYIRRLVEDNSPVTQLFRPCV